MKKTRNTRILIRRRGTRWQWLVVSRWDNSAKAQGFADNTHAARAHASLARNQFETVKP